MQMHMCIHVSLPEEVNVHLDVQVISTHFFLDLINNGVRVSCSFLLKNLKSLRILKCAILYFVIICSSKQMFSLLEISCAEKFL